MSMSVWSKFRGRAFRCTTIEELVGKAPANGKLERVLSFLDLVLLGVGTMLGAGVYVVTGQVAHEQTGPAIILSYAVAGIAAMFCALVYSEFAADIPVSGAAYNYIDLVFGEATSWLAASCILVSYSTMASAVAKGVAGYVATLTGIDTKALVFTSNSAGGMELDIAAAVTIIFLTALLAYGVRASFTFNGIATTLSLIVILFLAGAAIPHIDVDNYVPIFPSEFGSSSVFRGASLVFFSFIGFDALATVAEDAKNPSRDLPLSILTSLTICTFLYVLMATALVGMVSYKEIDAMAAFSTGFETVGWGWAGRIVSFGAMCGIITSLLGAMCVPCRMIMVLAREGFLPKILANVNGYTSTPLYATVLTGAISATMAMLLDLHELTSTTSMGILFVFSLVCMSSIWRRYVASANNFCCEDAVQPVHHGWIALRLVLMVTVGVFEGLSIDRAWPLWTWLLFIGCYFAVVLSFTPLPVIFRPTTFALSMQPLISCLGLLCCVHLLTTLGPEAYIRFAACLVVSTCIYFFYGMHRTGENRPSSSLSYQPAALCEAEPLIIQEVS